MPPLWGLALALANALIYATWIVLQARLAGDRPAVERGAGATGGDELALPPGDAEAAIEIGGPGARGAPEPAAAAAMMTSATAAAYAILTTLSGGSISPVTVPAEAWLPLLAFGLVATAIAIQTFYAGVRRVGAARGSLISTIEPVYTIVLATILFGESLAPVQVLGGVLVLGAVILAETGRREPERRRRRPALARVARCD
jgi:drug/metabolite transporter (DMT)-like permease